jgi:hypothetical protein
MFQSDVAVFEKFKISVSGGMRGRPNARRHRHLATVCRRLPHPQAGGVPQAARPPLASPARPHSTRERALARSACLGEHVTPCTPSPSRPRPCHLVPSIAVLRWTLLSSCFGYPSKEASPIAVSFLLAASSASPECAASMADHRRCSLLPCHGTSHVSCISVKLLVHLGDLAMPCICRSAAMTWPPAMALTTTPARAW